MRVRALGCRCGEVAPFDLRELPHGQAEACNDEQ
jgi:hypothetical protein